MKNNNQITSGLKPSPIGPIPSDWAVKLDSILDFLKQNREYNFAVHLNDYSRIVLSFETAHKKIISLLRSAVNSQSQPKLDSIMHFFKGLFELNTEINSFIGLIDALHKLKNENLKISKEYSYKGLFEILRNQEGWGNKTAALFAKDFYKIHNTKQFPDHLKIFKETILINKNDNLYLPVDAVIDRIFVELNFEKIKGFENINSLLHKKYSIEDMEIWDDLWFWGFITQNSQKNPERTLGFNDGKYWSLISTPKDLQSINIVKKKSEEFIIKIINGR